MQTRWTLRTSHTLGNLTALSLPFRLPQAVCQCISCTQERMAILLVLSLPHQEQQEKPWTLLDVPSLVALDADRRAIISAPLTESRTNVSVKGERLRTN